jgi:beta-carotene 3-hydroxylase
MQVLINIGIVIITIALMELFSWAMHKYLFHGPLWFMDKHIISKNMAG